MKNVIKTTLLALALMTPMVMSAASAPAVEAADATPFQQCSICYTDMVPGTELSRTHTTTKLAGCHDYHTACITEWRRIKTAAGQQAACPLCNGLIISIQAVPIPGAPVDAIPPTERLLFAMRHGNLEEIQLLLNENDNLVNSTAIIEHNPTLSTPLHLACSYAEDQTGVMQGIIRLFLNHGADVNATTRAGLTPLHVLIGSFTGNPEVIIRLLLDHTANINATDSHGDTPLFLANLEATRILLDLGADVNAANNEGSTPLDVALKLESLEKAELLIARGATCNWMQKLQLLKLRYEQLNSRREKLIKELAITATIFGIGLAISMTRTQG